MLVVTLRVVARGDPIRLQPSRDWDQGEPAPERVREISDANVARVLSRAGLATGDEVRGPTLIEQPDTTTLLAAGEVAMVDDAGNLVVSPAPLSGTTASTPHGPLPRYRSAPRSAQLPATKTRRPAR